MEPSVPPVPDPPDPPNLHRTTSEPMSPNSSSSTPPWIVWSKGLNALLDDPQGQDLFKTYLEEEGCYLQLTFLWACEGLKCTAIKDPPKVPELVKKIYRVFIPKLIALTDNTKSELAQAIVDERFNEIEIFSKAEDEVLIHMKENLYPNFLKSEIYLAACNEEEVGRNGESSSSGSGCRERRQSEGEESTASAEEYEKSHSPSAGAIDSFTVSGFENLQLQAPLNQLETVHEDKELNMNTNSQLMAMHSQKSKKHFGQFSGLTKEALLATEFQRATEFKKSQKTEPPPHYFVKPVPAPSIPFPYHASYASYNPVSRVDSEIQSMSSGMSDAMTDDGASGSRRRHHGHHSERKHDDRSSHRNQGRNVGKESHHSHAMERSRRHAQQQPMVVPKGAPLNTADDLRKLPSEGQIFNKSRGPGPRAEENPKAFAILVIEKLMLWEKKKASEKASEKDILAQAISKIHSKEEESPNDIIDMHFCRVPYFADVTPKSKSPKLRSPTIIRRRGPLPPAPSIFPVPPVRRRERDSHSQSTFSLDSGNVPDSESLLMGSTFGDSKIVQIPKSRSVPHELRAQQERRQPSIPLGGNPNSRGYHHQPRGFLGKVPLRMFKNSSEFIDSGISVVSGQSTNIMPPPAPSHQGQSSTGNDPVQDSRIRDWVVQAQSDQRRTRKQNPPEIADVREMLLQAMEPHTTALPRHSPPTSEGSSSTTSVHPAIAFVNYDDNREMPYSLKIPRMPGGGVTLAALKERLPRQGLFRYFFRTKCADLGSEIVQVQEEISDDYQELPMLNGKIYANLKALPGSSGMPYSQI